MESDEFKHLQEAFKKICRVCLLENENLHCLSQLSWYNKSVSFFEMLKDVIATETEINGLPENICSSCSVDVIKLYEFKSKFAENDQKLRGMLNDVLEAKAEGLDDEKQSPEYLEMLYVEEASNEELQTPSTSINSDKTTIFAVETDSQEFEIRSKPSEENIYIIKIDDNSDGESNPRKRSKKVIKYETPKVDGDSNDLCCPLCLKSIADFVSLNKHILNAHKDLKACPLCAKKCPDMYKLKVHILRHYKIRNYECHVCNRKFYSSGELNYHLKDQHEGKEKEDLKCQICDKQLKTLHGLENHRIKFHDPSHYTCDQCGMVFPNKYKYFKHRKSHPRKYNANEHLCPLCGKIFTQRSHLNVHLIKHNGHLFGCSVCNKGFTSKYACKQHEVLHTKLLKPKQRVRPPSPN